MDHEKYKQHTKIKFNIKIGRVEIGKIEIS